MPLDDVRLVVEPRYPYQGLHGFRFDDEDAYDIDDRQITADVARGFGDCNSIHPINTWYSARHDADVWVYHNGDGRSKAALLPRRSWHTRLHMWVQTMSCARAWNYETELMAVQKLKTLVSEAAFNYYVCTGSFLETSPRSGITYLFRKLRPTAALKQNPVSGEIHVLACLCLHPICYYEHTWSGGMVPTDDVIAHLLLMRGDEHYYWRKANQHAVDSIEAGM